MAAVVLNELGLRGDEVAEQLAELSNHPAWKSHELVEKLGIEIARQDVSLQQRLSDVERQDVEELLARAQALADAAEAAIIRQDFEKLEVLEEERTLLRERLHHLLVN
jgi:DNA-binding ferritin-like protein